MNSGPRESPAGLSALFAPRSIVVVGASDDEDKTGGRALDYLRRFNFGGRVYAVNPKREKVQGLDTYASISDLPEPPDLAIIAVPGEAAMEAVSACAACRIPGAIITTSGFAELGVEGRRRQEEMLQQARGSGLRLVGPNSQGIANFARQTVASFSSLFLTYPPADGPVAILSQSGSMSVVPYCELRSLGIGVRYCVATGNEVDITIGDAAEYAVNDPEIELVLMYAETISDPTPLVRAARAARARGIPMVLLKAGRTQQGQEAALSHTGALANPDRVVSAFCEHHGIWRVDDTDALLRTTPLYLKRWRPSGNRLAVLTDSGASAVMMADAAEQMGFSMCEFPAATRENLKQVLPAFVAVTNPVDMTSILRAEPQRFAAVLEAVSRENVACLLYTSDAADDYFWV